MAKRKISNPYGMGSIREKDGGLAITVSLGFKADGTRIRRTKQGFKTADDARKWGNELLRKNGQGIDVDGGRQTLQEFVDSWLPAHFTKKQLRPSTKEQYNYSLKLPLELFGSIPLEDIRPHHLDELVKKAPTNDYLIRSYKRMKQVLNVAKLQGLISNSPFERHEAPRPAEKLEARILERDELVKILDCAEGQRIQPILQVLHSTGMRIGECLALEWNDIDFEKLEIRVNRNVYYSTGEFGVHDTKSNSKRTLKISAVLGAILKQHQIEQRLEQVKEGIRSKLVFSTDAGTYLATTSLGRELKRVLSWANLPDDTASFHTFRHTHVALAIAENVSIYAISRRLGHSSAGFTLEKYGHLLSDGQDELALVGDFALVS